MKKTLSALLILALCLTFAACNNGENAYGCPDGKLVATNDTVDYYFFYPETWRLDRSDGMIGVLAGYDPSLGTCKASISVNDFKIRETDITDGEKYWTAHLQEYKDTFPGMTVVEETEVTIAQEKYPEKTYTASIGEVTYKYTQVFIVNSGRVYILTYSSTESDYETYIADFDELVTTFRGK